MISATQTIRAYVRHEYLLTHALRKNSAYQLNRSVECFVRTIGYEPVVSKLCDSLVNEWLLKAQEQYAPKTLHKMRGDILAVWRDAFDAGHCETLPKRVRKIKVPKPCPEAWTPEEVSRLVAACRFLPGTLKNGVRRCDYFAALISAAWDTGLRRGDLWRLNRRWIRPDGSLALSQLKTGDQHVARLSLETLTLLGLIDEYLPLEWPQAPRLFYYWWRRLKLLANVTTDGAMQRVRVSAATEVERQREGNATRFLGHTTPKADVHYLDRTLIPGKATTPGPLPRRS